MRCEKSSVLSAPKLTALQVIHDLRVIPIVSESCFPLIRQHGLHPGPTSNKGGIFVRYGLFC